MEAASSPAPYEHQGASLLAQQPVNPKPVADQAEWETIFIHLEASLGAMRAWRYSWWSHWSQLAQFFLPRRYHWVVTANTMNRGNPVNDSIIDATGALAVNICASGMWTGLTSPSRPWFKLEGSLPSVEIDADGKAWLEDVEHKVYAVLAGANFYSQMSQAFQDVTVFGTSPLVIYEDDEDIIRCYLPCAGEYYLKVGSRNSVDTIYREFVMTVQQIVEMFGAKVCPPQVQALWTAGGASLTNEFVVCHAIEPNFVISRKDGSAPVTVLPGKFAYREIYWLKGIKTPAPLSKRGFHAKPFMVARWSTVSNDPYGRSPCMDALGDNKQIQTETRRKGEFIEKLVRPPMGASPDMKNEPSSILPGMVTFVNSDGNGKKGFWPLFEVQAGALAPLVADIQTVSERIDKALFVDVFMAISRMEGVQPRNELELTKRDLERLQVLGPFITLFENEFAGPAIKRVIDIMERRKLFKPMPQSLKGVPIKIAYTSIMKLAQLSAEAVAAKDFLGTMGQLSSAAKAAGVPDPLRVVNLDKSARRYAEITNFWTDCLYTDDEVKEHDQIRTEEQQKAQIPGQAQAAVDAAHTLSQTTLPGAPGGSALSAIIGNQGQ